MAIKSKKKGFSLIELVVSMFIISILAVFIFLVPKLVHDTRSTVDNYIDYTEAFNLLHIALQKDLSKDYKYIVEENSGTVIINNVKYEFTDEGVYRTNGNNPQKLTSKKVYYEVDDEIMRVYTDKDANNNKIDLKFNLDYTTIQKGRK